MMLRSGKTRSIPRQRGSALALAIIMSIVLTGMFMALSWTAGEHAQIGSKIPKIDAAYYAAEAGAQQAVWKFKHDNSWRATSAAPFTGSINMYDTTWNFSVTCLDQVGDALLAWKLDDNAGATTADASGLGNIGTFHGGVSWYTPGRSGACVAMDGIDGYIDCGNNTSTNLTGDMSFSAWVKMNSGYYDQKIGGNQSGAGGGYKLCIYNSKAEFEVRDASNSPHLNRDMTGGTVLTMGTWYHIMGVYSESGHYIKTYVNGKLDRFLQGDGTGTGHNDVPANALGSTTGNFVMGKEPWDSLYYFDGYMDDIRIWNRALGDQDAKELYDTTVEIRSNVSGGTGVTSVANLATYTASIPTPPPPTIPAVTTGKKIDLNNETITGDLSADDVTSSAGASIIGGSLTTTKNYKANSHVTIQGDINQKSSVPLPNIDFTNLHNQATKWGKVISGDSAGQNFTFNSLSGNKVIWIKGNLTDPAVTISGTYAAGGTFVVDGKVTFTTSTTLGDSGYPVYIVAQGDITQTGPGLTLTGALYTTSNFNHKDCNITGPVMVNNTITNTATGNCTFTSAPIPWFDNRALPQPPSLPLYTANHGGLGP